MLWTAGATGCSSPQFQFFLVAPTVQLVQAWSSSPTFSWTTTGLAAGNYAFEVWARAGTNGSDGTPQSFVVPTAVTSVTIETWGAQGGLNATSDGLGGHVGHIQRRAGRHLEVHLEFAVVRGRKELG